MRSMYGNPAVVLQEIQGTYLPGRDACVPPLKFGAVAKLLWPQKTAAFLASISGKDERTAKRWLSGEYEPPAIIIAAIIVEITKRE